MTDRISSVDAFSAGREREGEMKIAKGQRASRILSHGDATRGTGNTSAVVGQGQAAVHNSYFGNYNKRDDLRR